MSGISLQSEFADLASHYLWASCPKPVACSTTTCILQEEAKDAFKELLASVGVSSDWSWEQTMRQIIGDPRCTLRLVHFMLDSNRREILPISDAIC